MLEAEGAPSQGRTMIQPLIKKPEDGGIYACMLWNVKSGRPTVATLYDELPDRWIGRRCAAATTSFEAPIEMFMKTDWRRGEPLLQEELRGAAFAAGALRHLPAGFQGFRP